jgi:hypothetical protein
MISGNDKLTALAQLSAAQVLAAVRPKTWERAPLAKAKGRRNERKCILVVKEWIRPSGLQMEWKSD